MITGTRVRRENGIGRLLWAGVLMLCVCAVLLSLIGQRAVSQHAQVDLLSSKIALLTSAGELRLNNPQQWLVRTRQLQPLLARFDSAANVDALKKLVASMEVQGRLAPRDTALILQQLRVTEMQLHQTATDLVTRQLRITHYFYWVLLGVAAFFVCGVVRRLTTADNFDKLRRAVPILDDAPMAVVLSDADDGIVHANQAYCELTNTDLASLQGRPLSDIDADDVFTRLEEDGIWFGEHHFRRESGELVSERVVRLRLDRGRERPPAYLTLSTDSTMTDGDRRLMLWQAHHDGLTSLPNANLLHEQLVRAIGAAISDDRSGAILSIDVNRFRQINDSIGHEYADRVLIEVAQRLALSARETDTVARVGGDQFVIALPDIDDVKEAQSVASSVLEAFELPFVVEEHELFLTVGIGIVLFPDDGVERGELLQKADAARLQTKQLGGNQMAFFKDDLNAAATRRLAIESQLRRAIEREELSLFFQPIIDCASGSVYGAEALLRWNNAELGFISPAEFIPIAEGGPLIVDLGHWVARQIRDQVNDWRHHDRLSQLRISLNVSALQFSEEADAQKLLDILAGGPAEAITVEITESALVTEEPGTGIFLQGLRDRGVRVALDDFGTGFSSIRYLRDFEFDLLKVDKSFIDTITASRDMGVVASIIAMGRILGMKVVAEGVEESEQVQQLKQIGCDYIQGYYYAKPMPVQEFVQFVLDRVEKLDADA